MGFGRVLLLTFVLASIQSAPLMAQVSDADGARALVGECANCGERGMQAVAEVIRRRGSLRGIYGFKASHVDHEPAWVWDQARKAWRASATSNISNGADHFESVDFKTPAWAKGVAPVSTVGKHRFYRLKGV